MKIEISGSTVTELKTKVFALAKEFGYEVVGSQMELPIAKPKKSVDAEDESPKRRPGRPRKPEEPEFQVEPKAEKPEPTKVTVQSPEPVTITIGEATPAQEETSEKTITFDDTKEMLKKVSGAHGIEKARQVLLDLGYSRISEVKEADYPKFMKACEAVLG